MSTLQLFLMLGLLSIAVSIGGELVRIMWRDGLRAEAIALAILLLCILVGWMAGTVHNHKAKAAQVEAVTA